MSDGHPCCVVLECDPIENRFVWMHLVGKNAGCAIACDFTAADVWHERLTYDSVLRGMKVIQTR